LFSSYQKKILILILDEEQTTTTSTRQAKSKALETLSDSHYKRRIEPESDLNEDPETSSLSGHVSKNIRRRRRSEKILNTKTFKRQRQSSSEEEEDNQFLNSKRNSAPIFPRRKRSDSEQQSEGTDTGNLCVKRGAGKFIQKKRRKRSISFVKYQIGGRELNTVVSDPSTSTNNRRSRRYTTKSYIDYLTTGQSSSR
jgi:hypothetical protein